MGEQELLPFAASLGVGGVLALAMFLVHRKDMQQHVENWRGQSQILAGIVEKNTAAITALTVQLDRVIDRLDPK